ncbi:pyruvate dehydrogenase (acetyl-transferring) E1 component subunit alpha [Miltoncostaea marina]|uniref:pyruvate dehydrogenase (acetyl-transferring) E1 component subunit alpha n=1 Tax=Miltoncostaea marina TaxID=2843215 RepID=UPI001C3CF585|nr:pyruvate dehydrogenase (acetyl-transferring) E1 component subunit alpha [Miltoncostaea marina]
MTGRPADGPPGGAGAPAAPSAPAGARDGLALWRRMLLVRRFEETCAELYAAGRIRGFLHLYVGEEAVAAGAMAALGPEDAVVATYREHAHALCRGMPAWSLMAEMLGMAEGCSRGRGGSMHLFDPSRRFYGGNAIVAAGLPTAVGVALADRMRGRRAVTACFFGDGAVAEGAWHESLNLAALWRLPVLFLCENNRYAMGTEITRALAEPRVARLAARYGMPAEAVDGMDVEAVADAAGAAAARVRDGAGPALLELETYRFRAHSMYDAERYRSKAEVARWRRRDPLTVQGDRLRAAGALDDDAAAEAERRVAEEIAAAVAIASAGTPEPVEDLLRFVHAEEAL